MHASAAVLLSAQAAHGPAAASASAAGPAMLSTRLSLGETVLNDGLISFVVFLVVLLLTSLIAIIRMPQSPARMPEQGDEVPAVLPPFVPAVSPFPPSELPPGQRGYAEAAYRLWPTRPMPPPAVTGAANHLGQTTDPSRFFPGQPPWDDAIRPPDGPGGPPWGPAPKPESEPPSWARPPGSL